MKRILLLVLLFSSFGLSADSNGMSKLIIPEDTVCYETEPLFGMDIEREIAEFEAQLAQELAEKAAQEMMAQIEAEAAFEVKAKLPNTVCGGPESLIRFCNDNPTELYCEILR